MPVPLPWDAGTLWFGLDPAQLRAGLAWRALVAETGRWELGTSVAGDILDASEFEATIRRVIARSSYERIVVAIEYPHWNKGGSPQVRAAANAYARLFKKVCGRGLRVVRVDPNDWQPRMIGTAKRPLVPGGDTKARAAFMAGKVHGYPTEGDDKERADAACLLEYVRLDPDAAAAATTARTSRKKNEEANVCPQLKAILSKTKTSPSPSSKRSAR